MRRRRCHRACHYRGPFRCAGRVQKSGALDSRTKRPQAPCFAEQTLDKRDSQGTGWVERLVARPVGQDGLFCPTNRGVAGVVGAGQGYVWDENETPESGWETDRALPVGSGQRLFTAHGFSWVGVRFPSATACLANSLGSLIAGNRATRPIAHGTRRRAPPRGGAIALLRPCRGWGRVQESEPDCTLQSRRDSWQNTGSAWWRGGICQARTWKGWCSPDCTPIALESRAGGGVVGGLEACSGVDSQGLLTTHRHSHLAR